MYKYKQCDAPDCAEGRYKWKPSRYCFACHGKGYQTLDDHIRNRINRAKNPKKNLLNGTINKSKKVLI